MSKIWGRPQTGRFRIAHGIIDVYLKLHRSTYEVLRILSASLFDKAPIKELFTKQSVDSVEDGQLTLKFI